MGICSMILPFFLGLLFVEDSNGVIDRVASYQHWKIFVIALMVITVIGVLVEYYFTRERVTEESFNSGLQVETKKSVPLSQQVKVCVKDKFWWIIIVFFLLYQLGGMVKNVSQLYYCSAMFSKNGVYSTVVGGEFSGTIAIVGAVPTALGMVIAWPLSNKIGKGRAICGGAVLAAIGGIIGFIAPSNFYVVLVSFVIKALGSTPAMYLSLALLADILDHQEALHGFRTDGFTMTIYGSIMAGMTGIATGILNGVIASCDYSADMTNSPAMQAAMPWVFIGVETICYAIIAVMFIFMGVEKFSSLDKKAIAANQKAEAEEQGVEYVDAATKLLIEEQEAEAASEEARKAELKAKCEKKGLDYEKEEAAYQEQLAAKKAAAAAKKEANDQKKAAAQKAKEEAQAQKLAAMTEEQRKAYDEALAQKAQKKAAQEKELLEKFNKMREENNFPAIEG
jgi:GPH family glycoside/pentoside/hexuronide:cation symporter